MHQLDQNIKQLFALLAQTCITVPWILTMSRTKVKQKDKREKNEISDFYHHYKCHDQQCFFKQTNKTKNNQI